MTAEAPVPLDVLLDEATQTLRAAGLEQARMEARALAGAVLCIPREAMVAAPGLPVEGAAALRFRAAVARRAAREPFARIVGRREFWSLDFVLSPETLVPRPETEGVVEAVLDAVTDRDAAVSILDLGTGTGCILLALLSELPNARGLGIDCAEGAVATARLNAERLGLSARAEFRQGDWTQGIAARFDVVVSNPPYVADGDRAGLAPEVRDHEPRRALFAGDDGLDVFRIIVPALPCVLAPGGLAVLECGQGQAHAAAHMLERAGFGHVKMHCDLAGIERVVTARIPGRSAVLQDAKKSVGKGDVPV